MRYKKDIIKSMVKEGLLNDDMEIVMKRMGKALLIEELVSYQKAKIEELIAEPMAVLALEVRDETVLTDSNTKEVIETIRFTMRSSSIQGIGV